MTSRFNPHPTRRLGAIPKKWAKIRADILFQSSPNPKVGCHRLALHAAAPEMLFQSSPNPKVGCHYAVRAFPVRLISFNPHPTRRLGAILVYLSLKDSYGVSILTQPEGWVP